MLFRIYYIDTNALRCYYFDGGRIYVKEPLINSLKEQRIVK